MKLFDETGTVCSIQGFHKTTTKKLSIQDELAIFEMVLDDPSVYLHELQHHVFTQVGMISVLQASVGSYISKNKLSHRAQQRSEQLREKYIYVYNPEMLVLVDETGRDRRAALRRYGYALQGKPAICDRLLVKGKR